MSNGLRRQKKGDLVFNSKAHTVRGLSLFIFGLNHSIISKKETPEVRSSVENNCPLSFKVSLHCGLPRGFLNIW